MKWDSEILIRDQGRGRAQPAGETLLKNLDKLWSAPWARGLLFGIGVGLLVKIFTLFSPPDERLVGTGLLAAIGPGGVRKMSAEGSSSVPEFPPRDMAMINIAQEYSNLKMWDQASKVVDQMKLGAARDTALDNLVAVKVFAGYPKPNQPISTAEIQKWIESLRVETERMSDSLIKVDRLIKLTTVDRNLANRSGKAGEPPSSNAGPSSPALLARAAKVAAAIPNAETGGWARNLGLTAVQLLAFGLLGMATAWVATAAIGKRQVMPSADPVRSAEGEARP